MEKIKILRGVKKLSSRVVTLDFIQADFGFFMEMVGGLPWEAALKGQVAQES